MLEIWRYWSLFYDSEAPAGAVEASREIAHGHEAGVRGGDGGVEAAGDGDLHGALQDAPHLGHGRPKLRLDASAQEHDLCTQAHFVFVEGALQARIH